MGTRYCQARREIQTDRQTDTYFLKSPSVGDLKGDYVT